jgi:molybdopterin-biosynthesis enzyme MoeA-like protein
MDLSNVSRQASFMMNPEGQQEHFTQSENPETHWSVPGFPEMMETATEK